ncbi:TcpQ domain-containing protein [Chromobacterium piscinae]|nr:TcpQ domain-containing protein [Chromobacterium piscinae]
MQVISSSDQIIITGRPDARYNTALANQRANTIRSLLLQRGISAPRIRIQNDASENSAKAGVYLSLIQIFPSSAGTPVARSSPTTNMAVPTVPRSPAAPGSGAQAGLANSDVRLLIVNKLLDINANGKIDPQTAITIMKEFTQPVASTQPSPPNIEAGASTPLPPPAAPAAVQEALAQLPKPAAVAPAAPPAAAEIISAAALPATVVTVASDFSAPPETAPKPKWVLDPTKTLKDNLEVWAKDAGYRLNWKASNYIKVNTARTYEKDFLDVMKIINASAGKLIKIEILPDEQPTPEIRVTDR